MKTRLFLVLAGAVSLLGLGLTACTTDDTVGTGGAGGTGGTATTTTTTTTTSNGTGGTGGGVGGGGGAGGAACISCSEALDDDVSPICGDDVDPLEPGSSAAIYEDLFACLCDAGGACEAVCGDNLCTGVEASAECTACTQDSVAGCKAESDACLNDT
jgi:hypothetical protein